MQYIKDIQYSLNFQTFICRFVAGSLFDVSILDCAQKVCSSCFLSSFAASVVKNNLLTEGLHSILVVSHLVFGEKAVEKKECQSTFPNQKS